MRKFIARYLRDGVIDTERTGFECPSWDLAEGRSIESREEADSSQPRVGWQQQAVTSIERNCHDKTVWPRLGEHEQAIMRSQRGDDPRPFPPQSSFAPSSVSPQLPVSSQRQGPPPRCTTAGVLRRRGWVLESVSASLAQAIFSQDLHCFSVVGQVFFRFVMPMGGCRSSEVHVPSRRNGQRQVHSPRL